jgi:hypothetical protein
MSNYTPRRTAYPFSAVNVRYKTVSERLLLQEQWNTFERVENYDDIIYQKYEKGLRDETYYLFASDQEFKNYKAGQILHVNAYPNLPPSTFDSIRNRPFPNVAPVTALPYITNTENFRANKRVPVASEIAAANADLAVYIYVSTYNDAHALKYVFLDDDEKTAYMRALNLLNYVPDPKELPPAV